MKKLLVFIGLGFAMIQTSAQEVDSSGKLKTDSHNFVQNSELKDRIPGWYISGNNSILFNQSSFSNWIAGGVNSYALGANIDYEFNLTKGKNIWDNRIIMAYGIQKNKGEDTRKNNDVINLTSSYGYEISKAWYLGAAMNFKTQFDKGWDYSTDPHTKLSSFMSPGYLTFGVGIDYKPNNNFQAYFHPATARFTFVTDKDLQTAGNFGLKEDGDSYLFEFGSSFGARYKLQVMENITYDNQIGFFSDYLRKPFNMDVAYVGVLDMKVNRFISAQATINLLYDEDQIKKVQLKQTLGVGLNYKFDNVKPAPKPEETVTEEAVPAS